MPRTMQCQSCRAILNLPDSVAAGKRLRCPKCGLRFVVTVADASSESTMAAPLDAESTHSNLSVAKPEPTPEDLPLSMADKDLRETFDLPLMSARDAERHGAAPAAVGDAESLLQDDPAPRRRPSTAEARSRARRCSNCGGLVPQGMSICVTCGVDQETGMRVGLEDDLAPPPPPPPSGPPIHVAVVGGLLGAGALVLLVLSLVRSVGGEGWQNYGWLCLALISAFSMFAAVQFIRLKTIKLLMVALTLGVVINMLALIATPLVLANFAETEQVASDVHTDNPDDAGMIIKGFEAQLDMHKLGLGVMFLVLYAVLAVYLMSPAVKRPFNRANASASW